MRVLRIDWRYMRQNLQIVVAFRSFAWIGSGWRDQINCGVLRQLSLPEDRIKMLALFLRIKEIMMSQFRVDTICSEVEDQADFEKARMSMKKTSDLASRYGAKALTPLDKKEAGDSRRTWKKSA